VLRQLVGGLVLMIEARARAKAQLGVQATGLELDGNNPLKFIRSPQRALLHLLDTPEAGFMTAERAIEDAFQDLQAHQMATLSAMRAALEGTLARFLRQRSATGRARRAAWPAGSGRSGARNTGTPSNATSRASCGARTMPLWICSPGNSASITTAIWPI
jgi:type VI secretion system protein ImpI/type VI secretion system protein